MITETVTYTDHNGVQRTDTLHFHISEVVLTENFVMVDKLQEFVDITEGLQGDKRDVTSKEIQQMLDLVKWFMRVSYGVKTPDGGFDQDEPAGSGEVWKQFRIHNAYPAFLMGLFNPDPFKLVDFIAGVIPDSLMLRLKESDDPKVQEALRNAEKRRQEIDRLPRGTRIVDDVPVAPGAHLEVVPQPADESDPDFDAMLAEANASGDPHGDKRPITKKEAAFMQQRLAARPDQFERFMSDRYISDPDD